MAFFHLLQKQRNIPQFASKPLHKHAIVSQYASQLLQEQPISPQLHYDRFINTQLYLNLHHDRFRNTQVYLNLYHDRFRKNKRWYVNIHHGPFLLQFLVGDTVELVWDQTLEIYWIQGLSYPKRTYEYYHLQHKSFRQQRKTLNISKRPSYRFKVSITNAQGCVQYAVWLNCLRGLDLHIAL